MIITCDECDSSFVLDDSLLKPSGSKVRCTSCGNIFVAYPGQQDAVLKAAPVVKKKKTAAKSVTKQNATVSTFSIEPSKDDPDLTKAVEKIVEDELMFSEKELLVTKKAKSKYTNDVIQDEIPPIEVNEKPVPGAVTDDEDEDEILDFSDFELDMDESDLPVQAADDFNIEENLDFSNLDDDLLSDSDDSLNLELEEDNDDLDLELGFDDNDDDLDLELGFDDNDDDLDLELGFDDNGELELNLEEEPELSFDVIDSSDTDVDELDFSDLELELDDGDSAPDLDEPGTVGDIQLDLDEDFNLDLEPDSDDPETLMVEDEFDFSDLDTSLDTAIDDPADVEDLDLELELEIDEPTMAIDEDDLDLSEFELDLDDNSTPPAIPDTVNEEPEFSFDEDVSPAADDELDFSDLADMLDNDPPKETSSPADDLDLDLDLDLNLDDDEDLALETENTPVKANDNEELDLSDLENILDKVDSNDTPGIDNMPDDDIELELDIDMDATSDSDLDLDLDLSGNADSDEDESFDFSDVEAMLEADDNLDESDDLELDFDNTDDDLADIDFDDDADMDIELSMEEDRLEDTAALDDISSASDLASIDDDSLDKTMRLSQDKKNDKKKVKKIKPKRKAGGKGSLFAKLFFLIFLLLVIALGVLLSRGKIENATGFKKLPIVPPVETLRQIIIDNGIPFLSDWVKIKEKDPKGILNLKISNITGDYISNESAEDIFVIKGKVQNGYLNTRNSLSLKCSLKNAEGVIVKSAIVFAGHDIEDAKLQTLDIESINNTLKKRLGTDNANAKVRPGQILPFTVVFSDFSDEFTEFLVEPAGSLQGAAMK